MERLLDLYKAFRETLIPDLTEAAFADMFAQTLAYGLFAARVNHKGDKPFSRADAAREVPKSNPFLRKLFQTISGTDLEYSHPRAPLVALVEIPSILPEGALIQN